MKKSLIVLLLTLSALLLVTGSAIAMSIVWKPTPIPETAIMLLFGITLIGISVVGRKLQKELKTIRA